MQTRKLLSIFMAVCALLITSGSCATVIKPKEGIEGINQEALFQAVKKYDYDEDCERMLRHA